jgi:signal transduction histidine kinase
LAQTTTDSLYQISTALARAKNLAEVGSIIAGIAAHIPGCNAMIVCVLDAHKKELELVGLWGLREEAAATWRRFPLDSNIAAAVAARTGQPIWIEHEEQWRGLVSNPQYASAVCLPLISGNLATIGTIAVSYAHYRTFEEEDRKFFQAIAAQCSLAVERCLLYEEERRARQQAEYNAERFAILLRLTQSMAESNATFEEAAKRLTDSLATLVGDASVIRMLTPDGERMRTIACSHVEPVAREMLQKLFFSLGETPANVGFIQDVISRGQTLSWSQLPEEIIQRFWFPPFSEYLERYGVKSIFVVPLRLDGAVQGLLTVARGRGGAPYRPEDQVLMEEAARRASVFLETAARREETANALHLRDEFLSVAAHEFKTPVTSLSLLFQIVAAKLPETAPDAADLQKLLELGKGQIKRMVKLLGDMLDVSKIQSGKLAMHLETADLAAIVRENVDLLSSVEPYPEFILDLKPTVGTWDAMRLSQVAANLLGNAVKFGNGKPVRVRVRKEGDEAILSVADEGIGIPPEKLGPIFDRFERAVIESQYQGMGLGLFIVKQIVDAHGGTIHVESEPGRGSVFTVRLPLHPPAS